MSVLIVNNQLVGWGKPKARYFFQMWRDIPSHVIYYRNKMKSNFLLDFDLDPVEPPGADWFRYDYLAKGEVPAGFWIQFNAGIKDEKCFLNRVVYKHYNPEINNLETEKLHADDIIIDSFHFLILLTNLASSTGLLEIVDRKKDNVLVGDDDKIRREFNTKFYNTYFSFVKKEIMENKGFFQTFLKLSGAHILAYLIETESDFQSWFYENTSNIVDFDPFLIHPMLQELAFNETLKDILKTTNLDMHYFQSNATNRFYMNNYQ